MANNSIPKTGEEKAREAAKAEDKKQEVMERQPVGPLQTTHGNTTVDDVVVAKVAGMATREVPGVYAMGSAIRRAFNALSDRIPNSQTNVTGGISVEKGERQTAIDVNIVVEYGASIVEVGNNVRANIIDQVEGTTGLEVVEVNVNVSDVHLPEEEDSKPASSPSVELA